MKCLVHIEVKSELAVEQNTSKLQFHHPKGNFELRIENCLYNPLLDNHHLSLYLIFDAADLIEAEVIANDHLVDALNILTLVTNSTFEYHRLVKIVDWTPGIGKRKARVFKTFNPEAFPQSFLRNEHLESVAKILSLDLKPEVSRALRWFRLGVGAETLEENFQFFWFALEIIANFLKPTGKVNDKCPVCHNPLYCEHCDKHPLHKPYPKQAIRLLVSNVIQSDGDNIFDALDTARNALMHGEELEHNVELGGEKLVDVLGRITWEAILKTLPPDLFDDNVRIFYPTTYVHKQMVSVVNISCHLSNEPDGEPSLADFPELNISLTPQEIVANDEITE